MFEFFRGLLLVMSVIGMFVVEAFGIAEESRLMRLKSSRLWPILWFCFSATLFFGTLLFLCFVVIGIGHNLNETKKYLIFLLPLLPIFSFYLTRFFIKFRPVALIIERK